VAFPNVVSRQTGQDASAQTSRNVAFSGTAVAGELLLVVFAADLTATGGVSFPGGWTILFDRLAGGGAGSNMTLTVAYMTAAGGETGVTVTTSSVQADWCAYRMDGGTTWDVQAGVATGSGGFGDDPNPPSFTRTGGAADVLWMALAQWDSAGFGQTATTAPAGYSNMQQSISTLSGAGFAAAEKQANAATEDAGAFLLSSSADMAAQTIAIVVTGGGGGPVGRMRSRPMLLT
jgi:hypothetical protein